MNKIRISRKAIQDLEGIWEYTREVWSVEQASTYYKQIYNGIRSLSGLPEYLIRRYDSVKAGLMGYRVGHHVIFYKKQKDGSVWIDRVLHERMDFLRHL